MPNNLFSFWLHPGGVVFSNLPFAHVAVLIGKLFVRGLASVVLCVYCSEDFLRATYRSKSKANKFLVFIISMDMAALTVSSRHRAICSRF